MILREFKGKSRVDFINDFCVIDIETTGLNPYYDEIIEIGILKYRDGKKVDEYQSLVQPEVVFLDEDDDEYMEDEDGQVIEYYVDEFITELTGITNEMLRDAPKLEKILDDIIGFIGNDLLIGHNVNFDVNFLYDNLLDLIDYKLSNDFFDIMRIARKVHPELDHHRLIDLVKLYNIEDIDHHRALADCYMAAACYFKLKEDVIKEWGSTEHFSKKAFKKKNNFKDYMAKIKVDKSLENPLCPIYKKYCVFTGKLKKYSRLEAMQLVSNLGGFNQANVNKKTNFLILGDNDYCTTIKNGKSNKHKKAEKYKLGGQDIEIIAETVFYEMLDEY